MVASSQPSISAYVLRLKKLRKQYIKLKHSSKMTETFLSKLQNRYDLLKKPSLQNMNFQKPSFLSHTRHLQRRKRIVFQSRLVQNGRCPWRWIIDPKVQKDSHQIIIRAQLACGRRCRHYCKPVVYVVTYLVRRRKKVTKLTRMTVYRKKRKTVPIAYVYVGQRRH